ncbi:putative dual specificity protein phosphatase DSP8 [Abeliophyllum distichum]|uniref:phosphatidylglycerophosphatase n=1 Tax=Abeliophyllum distichum TaxID=126358 RepID=A0ABD1PAA9_9LAMI
MYIEELKEEAEEQVCGNLCEGVAVSREAKRVLVGAGARALFYPTLLYNVVRNKFQAEFRWWDRVDEFVLLGAVPFPTDVPRLKSVGVGGVVTLNEPYETLVPTSLYHDNNIVHLVIPTRDYLFAPSYGDINRAVEFIHDNAHCGKTTYVHCKAGRGRSTTVVLCYLVKHKLMTPEAAYNYVRSIRPRVLLASSQWQAVQDYYDRLKKTEKDIGMDCSLNRTLGSSKKVDLEDFDDDGSLVLVTESDLDGYVENHAGIAGKNMLAEAALARLSCLWLVTSQGRKCQERSLEALLGTGFEPSAVDEEAFPLRMVQVLESRICQLVLLLRCKYIGILKDRHGV